MSVREVLLSDLVGRTVLDVDGRKIGRIQELHAEIELREHGNEYVVREFHVGAFGAFEALAGTRFTSVAMKVFGRLSGYRSYAIPWQLMDLSDLENPRARKKKSELHLDAQASSTST